MRVAGGQPVCTPPSAFPLQAAAWEIFDRSPHLPTPPPSPPPHPPPGRYLEIFGRKNNLRDFWVTIGNEVTGQGPPKDDQEAIAAGVRIPNAVYGRAG